MFTKCNIENCICRTVPNQAWKNKNKDKQHEKFHDIAKQNQSTAKYKQYT